MHAAFGKIVYDCIPSFPIQTYLQLKYCGTYLQEARFHVFSFRFHIGINLQEMPSMSFRLSTSKLVDGVIVPGD